MKYCVFLQLEHNVNIFPDVMFSGDVLIEIGDNVDIGNETIIYSAKYGRVKIGNNSMIAAQSYIIDIDHSIHAGKLIRNQENISSPITIGEDVWIAACCKILKGSTIEDGVIVGAQSFVKCVLTKNSINVGIPAKK